MKLTKNELNWLERRRRRKHPSIERQEQALSDFAESQLLCAIDKVKADLKKKEVCK